MVLFHATFMSLKAWCQLTTDIDRDEFKLAGEERLFKGYVSSLPRARLAGHVVGAEDSSRRIIDDDYDHTLLVYQDSRCNGIRLHASVTSGELRRSPVWIAFGMC
jgi:hypothetical protein